MLKLPLKKPILLITQGGKYLCRIIFAGNDFVTAVDVMERVCTQDGDFVFSDYELEDKLIIDRDKIVGYMSFKDDSEIEDFYEETATENRRNNLKAIPGGSKKTISGTKFAPLKIVKKEENQ